MKLQGSPLTARPPERTEEYAAFDLKSIVRETLMIAREIDVSGHLSNLLVELIASVVVARLRKGASYENRNH